MDGHRLNLNLPPNVQVIHLDGKSSVGAKRNIACEIARGQIISHVDDDDWYAPERLEVQVEHLVKSGAQVVAFNSAPFFDVDTLQARQCQGCILGTSFVYWRSWWASHRFPNFQLAEDVDFWNAAKPRVSKLPGEGYLVCRNLLQNKNPRSLWREWRVIDIATVPRDALRVPEGVSKHKA